MPPMLDAMHTDNRRALPIARYVARSCCAASGNVLQDQIQSYYTAQLSFDLSYVQLYCLYIWFVCTAMPNSMSLIAVAITCQADTATFS